MAIAMDGWVRRQTVTASTKGIAMKKFFALVAVVSVLAASSAFAQYVVLGTRCVTPYGWSFLVVPLPVGSSCFVATQYGPVTGYVSP